MQQHHHAYTRTGIIATLTAALSLSMLAMPSQPANAAPGPCPTVAGAMQINPDCDDATYANPVIVTTTDETLPVPHRRIAGIFDGTDIEFTIYLHAATDRDAWEGRFFQYTYPAAFNAGQNTARADDRAIGFALSSGGYAVQAGNASVSVGYRHTAAVAKFAETVAADWYGSDEPISGYLYGPSGGSFQTVGAAENTEGVWEGFVPMVQAVPQPSSYQFLGRSAAELILSDDADAIRDALLPGGSGDPYATLDEAESAMLRELHALGVPWSAWQYPDYLLGRDRQFYDSPLDSDEPIAGDAAYVDDFWGAPGYLGSEESPLGERVRAELAERGDTASARWNIAKRFQYRYQVPAADRSWLALEQFRDTNGDPVSPQRPIGPSFGAIFASGGAAFDGSVNGKIIAVSNLGDTDALPLHTDWYRQRVEASLGPAAEDTYRIYFNENADHQDAPPTIGARATFLVDWYGNVEQALRDVAAWAEDGVTPPESTAYDIVDGQVVVPEAADARGGVQPLVDLTAGGSDSVTVRVGQSLDLVAQTDTPESAGEVVSAEWDLDGDGQYTDPGTETGNGAFAATGVWTEPGEYLAAVRVASERSGDASAQHGLARNIDRIRVIVVSSAVDAPDTVAISGDAVVGGTLTAEPGTWGPDGVELSYQWSADGQLIQGATSQTFDLGAELEGRAVQVAVTGNLPGVDPVTATSPAVIVQRIASAPTQPSAKPSAGREVVAGTVQRDAPSRLSSTGAGNPTIGIGSAALLITLGVAAALAGRRRSLKQRP